MKTKTPAHPAALEFAIAKLSQYTDEEILPNTRHSTPNDAAIFQRQDEVEREIVREFGTAKNLARSILVAALRRRKASR